MSIWKNSEIKNLFSENVELLTLNEGDTKEEVYSADGVELIVKREDQNPTGSWKDRGSAYKITELKRDGIKEAVLFSSGNAVISLIEYAKLYPEFKLNIVLSNHTSQAKLDKINKAIENSNHEIFQTDTPKQKAVELSATRNIPNLRVSIDKDIHKGYWSLGIELGRLIKRSGEFKEGKSNQEIALFIPASSGTAAVGITQGLQMELGDEFSLPKIYICQTSKVHPFIETEISEESSADAIVDTVGLRKPQIDKMITETKGGGYAITDSELENARNKYSKNLSNNSLLSIAGFLKAKAEGVNMSKAICIASGL